jgi:hypothetical protein
VSIVGGQDQFSFDALPRKVTNRLMRNQVRESDIATIDQGD